MRGRNVAAAEESPGPSLNASVRGERQRLGVRVQGVVQGVGFRPFVYGLAARLGLTGWVLNDSHGVEIEIEGPASAIEAFLGELRESPPTLSSVKEVRTRPLDVAGSETFEIRASRTQSDRAVLVAPDYATCPDCVRELFDPSDRRHRYPFINCTNCGPRYTILRSLPYDRPNTAMADFPMCRDCRTEYEDPRDRRFHAEPTCCAECGPRVWLADRAGDEQACADPIAECVGHLAAGRIVAVKGLGGFHLACDASNEEAVRELRRRKAREEKPLAVMVRDIGKAEEIASVRDRDRKTLEGRERPILLVPKKPGHGLSEAVAPESAHFGVMLPYTPLHHLLMEGPYRALVMTSGNVTDEPIAYDNRDALERLGDIADWFLLHNRNIEIPADDSVVRSTPRRTPFLRRSRGYAPFPVELPESAQGTAILAVGPELKNTVCLTRGPFAFLSQHIGDLRNASAYRSFLQAIERLRDMLGISPRLVACDSHPDYLSTRYAREMGLPLVAVQHHHAHIASVLAEKQRDDRVIGVAFDGAGWGENGEVWGGEFLLCDLETCERAGHFETVPLPGGDAAARRPSRMAYVHLRAALGDEAERILAERFPHLSGDEVPLLSRMIEKGVNCPRTSSAGRLFDAVSALLGVCSENTYEGQAPMELEGLAMRAPEDDAWYEARVERDAGGTWVVRTSDLIQGLAKDVGAGVARETVAARFHRSVARLVVSMCLRLREQSGLSTVALSGGVFSNAFLAQETENLLEREGFETLVNSLVPAGDGGIALGQAAVAGQRAKAAQDV
ncbi:carbamoyltransferase HypF [Candidatus Sumerlaeota bacterium]|nr:carbamoyltransferase HypF [Candidatus Sumerlaeota bacterium]